jgi:transcription elongation factor GreA
MDQEKTKLTKETFDRLSEELNQLKTAGRVEIARAIESARALGDLSENGDYHAAKDSQGKMEARIRQLENLLLNCELVNSSEAHSNTVCAGIIVSLLYDGDSEPEKYLVGSIEEKPDGVSVLSPNSPLGQALMGRCVGDTVEYEAPNGKLTVKIVEIC